MRQLIETAALLVLFGITAGAAPGDPTFRLVSLDTSSLPKVFSILDVRPGQDGSQALVPGDFQLLEDGKATSVAARTLKFRDTGMGLALVVAIDVSPSMEGRPLNAIRDGLTQLVSRKRNEDRVTVLSFADDLRWETRWDASSDKMKDTFQRLRTRGNATRLYDAVGQAMDELAVQSRQDTAFPSRMCILVLSDGHDEGSRASLNRIVARLRTSRIRLDSVGLAHSPMWLRSLQSLTNAGFGGFRTASTPEQLTQLLGDGIDTLLDMPAIEFSADRKSGDGKSHQMGIEHLPTHWRDQMAVTLPQSPLSGDWRLWVALAAVALLVTGTIAYFVRRRMPSAVAAGSPSVLPSAPPPPAPYRRTETKVETASDPPEYKPSIRVPTEVESRTAAAVTRSVSSPEVRPQSPPARVHTLLAPHDPSSTAFSALFAAAGPYAGQRFPLSADEFWIGSSPNNHLCLSADSAVSGNHACIRLEASFYRLYDNGSLNNTMVNGRPVGREVVLLQAGDRIRIGQSEFTLER